MGIFNVILTNPYINIDVNRRKTCNTHVHGYTHSYTLHTQEVHELDCTTYYFCFF